MSSNLIQALFLLFAFWIVYLLSAKATPSRAATLTAVALILGGGAVFVVFTSALFRTSGRIDGRYLILILATYLITSIITFLLYGYDKRAAKEAKDSRIPERTLHVLELMGGWPGAFLGVRYHRNKTDWKDKRYFKLTTWAIAIGHLLFWSLWATGVINF